MSGMPSLLRSLTAPAAAPLRRWVLGAFPRGESGIEYDSPTGDPGQFGPDSVTWRVHAEFPGMLAGGLCALMLQALHPRALAAVYDHSNFREDLVGRLRRTTHFVAGTTYAPTAEAERLIARVRAIHARIAGYTSDGQPYRADEPALLTWVHVTEAYGFLQGCRRYGRAVPVAIADRYYAETRRVAEALGATGGACQRGGGGGVFRGNAAAIARGPAGTRSTGCTGCRAAAGAGSGPVARCVPRRGRGTAAGLGLRAARARRGAACAGSRLGTDDGGDGTAVSRGASGWVGTAGVPADGLAGGGIAAVALRVRAR